MLGRRVLHELLGNSLRRSHHARRANRLVRRDENEMLDVRLNGCINDVARTGNVIRDCLEDVVLHQWNVLMCRRVEDRVRSVLLEDVEDSAAISNVGDDRHELDIREAESQLLENVEDRIFAVTQQNQSSRGKSRELTAELASNRSARAGDENRFTRRQLSNCCKVCFYCIATEEILNLDFAKSGSVSLSRNNFGETWNRARRNAARESRTNNLSNDCARRGRHRDDDFGNTVSLDNLRYVRERSEDWKPRKHVPVFRSIAVDEPDGLEPKLGCREQFLHDELSGIAGTGDQNAFAAFVPAASHRPMASYADHQSGQGDQRPGQQRIDEDNGEGNSSRRQVEHREDDESNEAGHCAAANARDDNRPQLTDARVSPQSPVHPRRIKQQQAQRHREKKVQTDES